VPLVVAQLGTEELAPEQTSAIRELLWAAFADDEDGGFDEDDWEHALGGAHFIGTLDGRIVAHAAVVQRALEVAGVPLRTGYVEAVAVTPTEQRRGRGTAVMRAVNAHIAERYDLGALGTGSHSFYERLGWQVWRGPTFVRAAEGLRATPDEDGYVMVLLTPAAPSLDLNAAISCEWRPGDVW
jgi:aminoglycoside 2'-N-acetyltransferase I